MKIKTSILATAISLTIFACSESPSSPSDDSSSSEVLSSSSHGTGGSSSSELLSSSSSALAGTTDGKACQYSGEDFGLDGLTICEEIPSNTPDMYERKIECEQEGGTWLKSCPSGEKASCINDIDEEDDTLYKLYTKDFYTCGDLLMKNADGSEDVVSMGGACGPFRPKNVPLLLCTEFREVPTTIVKISCAELETSFVERCPVGQADLICYNPEEKMISYFYGEAVQSHTCEDFKMEEL